MTTKIPAELDTLKVAARRLVPPVVLVLMGVSGSGKTTIALELHRVLRWPFQEGDDLHPPANVAKMRLGRPLNDADRLSWLQAIARWIDQRLAAREPESSPAQILSGLTARSPSAIATESASFSSKVTSK